MPIPLLPLRLVHVDSDLGLVRVPRLGLFVPPGDWFLVLTCHSVFARFSVSLTCSSYHAAAVVAASVFIGLIDLLIGLIHLHNQTVRVHSEEVLHSERGYGLWIRNEEILYSDA